jgi:hypothetical protein
VFRSMWRANSVGVLVMGLAVGGVHARAQQPAALDVQKISELAGTKATRAPEGVVRLAWPRTDIKATIDGQPLPPFAGLTSWAAFQPDPKAEAMLMGDVVLLQDEVNPVMDVLLAGGLSVTALHNHFFYDEPRVYFMHISGAGEVARLVPAVRSAIEKSQEIRKASPEPPKGFGHGALPSASAINAGPLAGILGQKEESKDGMAKFTFGRETKASCGCKLGSAMGVNTWAAFVGSDDQAFVDGDFVCLPGELQPTLKALRKAGINIVAVHNHMEDDSPRTMFLHYWGTGPAQDLARGVRAALDAQKTTIATAKGQLG